MKNSLSLFVLFFLYNFLLRKKYILLSTLKNYNLQIMRFIILFMERVQKAHYEQLTTSRWTPGKIDGKETRVKYTIPITVL